MFIHICGPMRCFFSLLLRIIYSDISISHKMQHADTITEYEILYKLFCLPMKEIC